MRLPRLPASTVTKLLDALPSRLERRAEALVAEAERWEVSGTETATVIRFGEVTVEVGEQITCDCLLAPCCAHIAAVALAASVDTVEPVEDVEPPLLAPSILLEIPETARAKREDMAQRATLLVNGALRRGVGGLSITEHSQSLALLQAARAAGLPRLERVLTAVVEASTSMRLGASIGRDDLGQRVAELALSAHLLNRDPADPNAVGRARRSYSSLEGRGTGVFVPVVAEPVISTTGTAGVTVSLMGGDEFLQFGHTPPGTARDIIPIWRGRVMLGDLHCSYAELVRHRLLLSGAPTSEDGQIGRGPGVRAALGKEVGMEDLVAIPDHPLIAGDVVSANRRGFALTTDSGPRQFTFLPAARRSGVAAVASWLINQKSVVVLSRDGAALRLWGDSGEQVFPGLDRPPLPDDHNEVDLQLLVTPPNVRVNDVLQHWLGVAATGGAAVVRSQTTRLEADASTLVSWAAPGAAKLLREMGNQCDARRVAAIAAYMHG